MKELKDADGTKISQGVWKKEEIYLGKYLDELPDIIILPRKNYVLNKTIKNKFIQKIRNPKLIGKHHWSRSGIFIHMDQISKKFHP